MDPDNQRELSVGTDWKVQVQFLALVAVRDISEVPVRFSPVGNANRSTSIRLGACRKGCYPEQGQQRGQGVAENELGAGGEGFRLRARYSSHFK
jgi:hypothetical protein